MGLFKSRKSIESKLTVGWAPPQNPLGEFATFPRLRISAKMGRGEVANAILLGSRLL